jgi:hypothetical protein
LPMHPYLNKDDQNKIIEKLNSIIFWMSIIFNN